MLGHEFQSQWEKLIDDAREEGEVAAGGEGPLAKEAATVANLKSLTNYITGAAFKAYGKHL